jgi:hypothetical protein
MRLLSEQIIIASLSSFELLRIVQHLGKSGIGSAGMYSLDSQYNDIDIIYANALLHLSNFTDKRQVTKSDAKLLFNESISLRSHEGLADNLFTVSIHSR